MKTSFFYRQVRAATHQHDWVKIRGGPVGHYHCRASWCKAKAVCLECIHPHPIPAGYLYFASCNTHHS